MFEKFTHRGSESLLRHRWLFCGILVATALLISVGGRYVRVDNSLASWFLEKDEALQQYREFGRRYGNDEVLLALIKAPKTIFDPDYIATIFTASRKLDASFLTKRVLSLTKSPYIGTSGDDLVVEDLVSEEPTRQTANALKKKLYHNPKWARLIVNDDETSSAIIIEPTDQKSIDEVRPALIALVKETLAGSPYRLAGMGVMYQELNEISQRDAALFVSLSYVVLLILLFLFFRSIWALLFASATIVVSLLIFIGLFGLAAQTFNMVSMVLPTLITVICLADVVHLLTHWRRHRSASQTLTTMILPCLLTSITTACGFLALCSSNIALLRSMGIFAAIGVLLAYICAMVLGALFLSAIEKRSTAPSIPSVAKEDPVDPLLERLLTALHIWIGRHPKAILATTASIMVIALIGILLIRVDTYSLEFLLNSNPVKKASRAVEAAYGNYLPLEIRVRAKSDREVQDPVFLKAIAAFQDGADHLAAVSHSLSLADLVRHLNKVLTEDKLSGDRIPESSSAIAQQLLLYEMDPDNHLDYFLKADPKETRLTLKIPMVSARSMKRIMQDVEALLKPHGHIFQWTFGGYVPLYVKMMSYITESQVTSFSIALIVIFAMMGLLFRSLPVFVFGVIVNVLPIALVLAVMGFFGINLDIATVTIAAIAIGIVVDDTIHFLFMYQTLRKRMGTSEAVQETLLLTGRAIVTTSLILIVGFSVMLLANIKSIIFFGLLITLCIGFALLADLVVLPALFLAFDQRHNRRQVSSATSHIEERSAHVR